METCLTLKDLAFGKGKPEIDGCRGMHDQKENICFERRRATPYKPESVPKTVTNRKSSTPELVHNTPIKHQELGHPDPWTPTANLKMLISAASPDIRDREMKKVLFRPIENSVEEEEVTELDDPSQFDAEDGSDEFEKKPSRKQKSLGLLCQKFLALYPDYPAAPESISISLDEVAMSLGVERRRIYDIVNVLESLMLVSRVAKNQYVWHGRPRMGLTLQELHRQGREQRYHLQMEQSGGEAALRREGLDTTGAAEAAQGRYVSASRRKDKSLRIMSKKFVMLFLVSKTQTVTLDTAAKILIEESQDADSHSKYKTKVRRLYDIANVLTSLALIKKVHVREERGRKPAFKWIGPTDFHGNGEASSASPLPEAPADAQPIVAGGRRERLARHASFQVVPTSVSVRRQAQSAPTTPRREPAEPVDYSRRSCGANAVCRLQFEDGASVRCGAGQSSPLGHSPAMTPMQGMTPEVPFATLPLASAFTQQHQLAYLPTLTQASVLMLYGGHAPDTPDGVGEGQRSPSSELSGGNLKRRRDEEGDEGQAAKRDKQNEGEGHESMQRECESHERELNGELPGDGPAARPGTSLHGDREVGAHGPGDIAAPSHYLYVPNTAGLNNLNFFLPAGHPAGGMTVSPGGVPTLAMPCVLVPSSALRPYAVPAMPGEAHGSINFNVPAVVSPQHFVMGGLAFPPATGTADQGGPKPYGSPAPPSPLGPSQPGNLTQTAPMTPLTPKEAAVGSKAFFQTPGTLEPVLAPVQRRRASAQRRLDISHLAAN